MKLKKTISAFLLCAVSVFSSFAIKVPELTGPVVDKAGLLSREQFSALDSELRAISRETGTQIAVLTIPKNSAQEVADRLVNCGIRAIWNFAHLDLKVPEDVVVENVHLSESLMQLSYRISEKRDKK